MSESGLEPNARRVRRVDITTDVLREFLHLPSDCEVRFVRQSDKRLVSIYIGSDNFDEVPNDQHAPIYCPTFRSTNFIKVEFEKWGEPLPQ